MFTGGNAPEDNDETIAELVKIKIDIYIKNLIARDIDTDFFLRSYQSNIIEIPSIK
jgi:hypothetical protein